MIFEICEKNEIFPSTLILCIFETKLCFGRIMKFSGFGKNYLLKSFRMLKDHPVYYITNICIIKNITIDKEIKILCFYIRLKKKLRRKKIKKYSKETVKKRIIQRKTEKLFSTFSF